MRQTPRDLGKVAGAMIGLDILGLGGYAGATGVLDGEATINAHAGIAVPMRFFSSWSCPYAQRVWIGLEEKNSSLRVGRSQVVRSA